MEGRKEGMEEGDVVINREDKKRKLEYFTLNTLKK